jgi:hypothetical protein
MTTPNKTPSAPVAPPQPTTETQTPLEASVSSRRAELIAKLVEIKRDTSTEAAATRLKLKKALSELGLLIKETVVDGWATVSEAATIRLDHWLAESRKS